MDTEKRNKLLTIVAIFTFAMTAGIFSYTQSHSKNILLEDHLLTLKGFILNKSCPGYRAACGNFFIEEFSHGETLGMKAYVVKVRWDMLSTVSGKSSQCSFLHYVKEDNIDTFLKVIQSAPQSDDPDCKQNATCYNCQDKSFSEVAKELGYSGGLPY